MDGPTSRLPSTVTNPDRALANAVTARQSLRELYSSAPATPSSYVDPPRPPKEGHEWVWFPGGYWAEREVVDTPSKEFIKVFKWRKRSAKGSSSRETTTNINPGDSREQSPRNSPEQQLSRMPLPSPYLTEEAHVQSLQQPYMPRNGNSSDSASSLWLNRLPKPPLPSPYITEEAHVQALQRPSAPRQKTNSSESASMFKSMRTLPSSPLTQPREDSEPCTPISVSTEEASQLMMAKCTTPIEHIKTKRSFIDRFLSPETRPSKPRKPSPLGSGGGGGSSEPYTTLTTVSTEGEVVQLGQQQAQIRSHTPISRVAALLREETRKPRKMRSMRLFGKSPWHRKTSGGSETSVSSSVRDVLRGKTPKGSPASDEESLFEPCNSWSAQYPGGEAIRVKTPPLRQNAADNLPRSFFFDISSPTPRGHPQTDSDSNAETGHGHTPTRRHHHQRHSHSHESRRDRSTLGEKNDDPKQQQKQGKKRQKNKSRTRAARATVSSFSTGSATSTVVAASAPASAAAPAETDRQQKNNKAVGAGGSCKEWWDVQPPPTASASHPRPPHLSPSSYEAMAAASSFEFDVPEHLPTSPMCPANKRHRSGGTGICVYHGRRKRSTGGGDNDDDGGGVGEWRKGVGVVGDEDNYYDDGDDFWT